jgi:large subunit ribosomal protein L6
MSRLGKKPLPVPANVKFSVDGRTVNVEGPKGKLQWEHRREVAVKFDEAKKQVAIDRLSDERPARAFQGLTWALVKNMIEGAAKGYEKKLEIVGVGYQATMKGKAISLRVGLANELVREIPAGLTVTCPDNTHIVIQGANKQQVGQFAAELRSLRKPEPYKGKGVRYQNEYVKIKPGKAATK